MMSKRRKFGELVVVDGDVRAVIVRLNPDIGGADKRPCWACDDCDCEEFDNLMTENGEFIYHISECRMSDW